jgi:diguanylate cyclase (GGDEF)-like protein
MTVACLTHGLRLPRLAAPRLHLSARGWMTVVGLLALLPMLAFALVATAHLVHRQEQQARAALERRATLGAHAVAGELAGMAAQLRVAALGHLVPGRDLAGLHALAQRMVQADTRLHSMSLHDAQGQRLLASGQPWAGDHAGAAPRAPQLQLGQALVMPLPLPMQSSHDSPPDPHTLGVVLPLHTSDGLAYTLRAALRPQALDALLNEQRWPADWTGTVVDQNLAIVARTRDPQAWRGRPVSASLAEALRTGRSGVFDSHTRDGIVVLASAARVAGAGSGWWVVVAQPKAALQQQARAALAGLLLAGALGLAAAVWMPLALARRLGQEFRDAARQPGQRGASHVAELGVMQAHASQQAQALLLAQHDPVTGLPGRALFTAQAQALRQNLAATPGRGMALLYVDLDGFKRVNDLRGHEAGDALLAAVASVLQAQARVEDVPGRLGGDEFALAVTAPEHLLGAVSQQVAHRVRHGVAALDLALGCSVGVALVHTSETLAAALARADQAMLVAKRRGKNRVVVV